MKIAIDAMGGDAAPTSEVEGAVWAAREFGVEVILVGDEPTVSAELKRHSGAGPAVSVQHAPQRVEMHESPSFVIRRKRESSIWIATQLVKQNQASAVISAGNTGAAMATSLYILGPLKGVERPAIATTLPTLQGTTVLIDVGANVDCKPLHLFQFALMGSEYAEQVLGKPEPKVGLLSIGEEDTKGNEVTKEAFKIMKASTLNFVGNVEGRDIYTGVADVVVCDGFIGNVALKVSEGLAEAMGKLLRREIAAATFGKLGYFFLRGAFGRFRRRVDYAEYGGAPLLGVNGTTIICHGRSSPKAIKNAVAVAKALVENKLNDRIRADVDRGMQIYSRAHEEFLHSQKEPG